MTGITTGPSSVVSRVGDGMRSDRYPKLSARNRVEFPNAHDVYGIG